MCIFTEFTARFIALEYHKQGKLEVVSIVHVILPSVLHLRPCFLGNVVEKAHCADRELLDTQYF